MSERRQGIFWIGTIPGHAFTPYLPPGVRWIRGQLEEGKGGFIHWQLIVALSTKGSMHQLRELFGPYHFELSRSRSASEYVWKDDTRVPGTQFELGQRPIQRNDPKEWDKIWDCAIRGDLCSIPSSVRVQSYRTLRAISADYAKPVGMVRTCIVYWGPTGTGKSRRAWDEAGMDAYPKDPNSKFWCGYNGQKNVVIDEFRGRIDISHLLRWLDRYPTIVEIKGSSVVLSCTKVWITSNLSPIDWFPEVDAQTVNALLRRLEIINLV